MLTRASLLIALFVCTSAAAQVADQTTSCRFTDGKAMVVRYKQARAEQAAIPSGKVWSPGGSPMFLFTEAPLKIGDAELKVGAYGLHILKNPEQLTLIVNTDVGSGGKYDSSKDVVRVPMQIADSPTERKRLELFLGKVSDNQCNLRIYIGKTAAFGAEFKEQRHNQALTSGGTAQPDSFKPEGGV